MTPPQFPEQRYSSRAVERAVWRAGTTVEPSRTRILLTAICVIDVILVAASFAFAAWGTLGSRFVTRQLNMNLEAVFGAWYPSVLLLALGWIALMNHERDREEGLIDAGRSWLLIALGALCLSIDEVCTVHEVIGKNTAAAFGSVLGLKGVFAWVAVLAPAALAFTVIFVRFILRRFKEHRLERDLLLLGIACWVSALVLEAMAGTVVSIKNHPWEQAFEESFEIIGTTLMIFAFTRILHRK